MASRHDLTLQKKVEFIFDYKDGNGLSQRVLSENYHISLGSVSNILKRRKEYLHDYETNQNQQVKRKFKNVNSQKLLDDHVYEWFVQQRAKNIPISRPILQEKAPEISEALGDNVGKFKAFIDWLEKFRVDIIFHIGYSNVCLLIREM
jgi:uncharacterized protein (DUF2461 family)